MRQTLSRFQYNKHEIEKQAVHMCFVQLQGSHYVAWASRRIVPSRRREARHLIIRTNSQIIIPTSKPTTSVPNTLSAKQYPNNTTIDGAIEGDNTTNLPIANKESGILDDDRSHRADSPTDLKQNPKIYLQNNIGKKGLI